MDTKAMLGHFGSNPLPPSFQQSGTFPINFLWAHRIVASCTASAHARSYSSRLICSSIVYGSFCPAPKVTVRLRL